MNALNGRTSTVCAVMFLLVATLLVAGCSSGRSSSASYTARPNDGHIHEYNHRLSDDAYICALCGYEYQGDPSVLVEGTPDMDNAIHESNKNNKVDVNKLLNGTQGGNTAAPAVDPRWPTTNQSLLAIPEGQRWYNGWAVAGTNCTLAGPVVRVYQAQNEAGAPIFIDMGEAYPSTNGVTLLVWGDQYYDFAEMIDAVDDGGAWLSVSGYLSVYNGRLQFDAGEGPVQYTWWG